MRPKNLFEESKTKKKKNCKTRQNKTQATKHVSLLKTEKKND